jgi:hypothetical protein
VATTSRERDMPYNKQPIQPKSAQLLVSGAPEEPTVPPASGVSQGPDRILLRGGAAQSLTSIFPTYSVALSRLEG